jgi:hypothetical protein
MRPVSVDEELARGDSPMVRGGLSIVGYFDNHGLYHRTGGRIRRAGDRTLELRTWTGHMRSKTVRLSVDSVRTVMTRSRSRPSGGSLFVPSAR